MDLSVTEIVQALYDLTQSTIRDENLEEISAAEYKELFFNQVSLLAAILGIDLYD